MDSSEEKENKNLNLNSSEDKSMTEELKTDQDVFKTLDILTTKVSYWNRIFP
jgi:hypothetical protein